MGPGCRGRSRPGPGGDITGSPGGASAIRFNGDGGHVYLSEDNAAGGFYRFTPDQSQDLTSGLLEVAKVSANARVEWVAVPDASAGSAPTREQVPGMTVFNRGEGIWFDSGTVYLCTTNDSKIHTYDTQSGRMDVLYDAAALEDPPLTNVDNVTISRSGDLFVCEDTSNSSDPGLDIGLITPEREVTRFLKVTGPTHTVAGEARSELCGVVFDPSGDRLFFASQRGFGLGVIYEITGPFRKSAPGNGGMDGLRVRVPSRIRSGALLDRGLRLRIETDERVEITARLTADLTSSRASRRTTLARLSRELDGQGNHKLRLRPRKSKRRRIARARSFRARLTITATDAAGRRRKIKRSVRVT